MINYYEDKHCFIIETKSTSYVFGLNNKGVPIHIYYGAKLSTPEDLYLINKCDNDRFNYHLTDFKYAQEYVTCCQGVYDEESLKIRYSDGVSDVVLSYKCHQIVDNVLTVTLSDNAYSLDVLLQYTVLDELDLIERKVIIQNSGDTLIIENAASANVYLPLYNDYEALTYSGSWGREYSPVRCPIIEGKLVFDTRRGTSSGPHHVPFFAATNTNRPAYEQNGEIYFGMLKYSGNFKTVFEKNHAGLVKITSGINFYDTTVSLDHGKCFETPSMLIGYTENGYSGMREIIYDLEYDYLAEKNNICKPFPIIYNSWYPYKFDVDEQKILSLIEKVKNVGAELLVIDDGWMIGRTNDSCGLGDWHEDAKWFPHGMREVSNKVHESGLLFGLWIEPEMITEDSTLYKEHPDWVLAYPIREKSYMRSQRVLNLARDDVYDFCEQTLDRVIEDYALDYLKWDMNRYICETDTTQDFFIRYASNLMKLYEHIRKKYPRLLIENCAHGGARCDFGLFEYCDRINRSDNADPIDVLRLHDGFTDMFLPRYAGGAGNIAPSPYYLNGRCAPLDYRAMLGMTGSMSVGIDLLTAPNSDVDRIKDYICYYKTIRNTLHNSYVYKLSSPTDPNTYIWEYVSRDRSNAVVFVFSHGMRYADGIRSVKLMGLVANKQYKINEKIFSGDTLMKYGLVFENDRIKGDYYSKVIEIKEAK